MKAQKSLNTCLLGNTTIVAELVPDEFVRSMEQQSAMASTAPSQWPQSGQNRSSAIGTSSHQRQDLGLSSWGVAHPTGSGSLTGTSMWGNMGGAPGSAGGLWGDNLDDNSTHNLLGNIMGETM